MTNRPAPPAEILERLRAAQKAIREADTRRSRATRYRRDVIREAQAAGMTLQAIADVLGISKAAAADAAGKRAS